MKDELRIYGIGGVRPREARNFSLSSMNESSALNSTDILNSVPDGIPVTGKHYVIERDISVFETDIPPQHMWSPGNSKKYRVLWERKLKSES